MPFENPNPSPAPLPPPAEKNLLLKYRVEQLEKQQETLAQDQKSWAQHTEAQTNQTIYNQTALYTNELNTISTILEIVSFILVAGGSFLVWVGYINFKKMISTRIDKQIGEYSEKLKVIDTQAASYIAGLKVVAEKQEEQDKRIRAMGLSEQGDKAFIEKNYSQAIDHYTTALKIRQDANIYLNRGAAKGEMGSYEAAIEDYDIAIQLDPNLALAYSNRAVNKGKMGNHRAAIEDCDVAIRLNPKLTPAYSNRGVNRAEMGNYEAAIEDYNAAISINPRDANAYFNRACSLARMKKSLVELLSDLKKAIELDKKYRDQARKDPDFDGIRSDPDFRALVGSG